MQQKELQVGNQQMLNHVSLPVVSEASNSRLEEKNDQQDIKLITPSSKSKEEPDLADDTKGAALSRVSQNSPSTKH